MTTIIPPLRNPCSAVNKALNALKDIINAKDVWSPREDVLFVFLCGANRGKDLCSKRREAILSFAKRNLPNTEFFLAESVFNVLKSEGHKKNILDVESDISAFADYVLIVLESESAFCELGAFASSKNTRNKLIVINDITHRYANSFINMGPIKAIEETVGEDKLLYYKMSQDGRERGDAIGHTFSELYNILNKEPATRRRRVEEFDPTHVFTKNSLRFMHDLIYFSGPILSSELKFILDELFGNKGGKQLNNHLGLLVATAQIATKNERYYISTSHRPYFQYGKLDQFDVMAAFRTAHLRYDSQRIS